MSAKPCPSDAQASKADGQFVADWVQRGQQGAGSRTGHAVRARQPEFVTGLASFYRLRSYQSLVSGQRAVFYTLFGYAIAARGTAALLVINTAATALLFMFFGAYDNYWDWRLLGQRNGTSAFMDRWALPRLAGFALTFVPWLLVIPAIQVARAWGMSRPSETLFWSMTLLGFAYITPGIRLKRRPLNFFIAPVWACLLFLQAYTLSGRARWSPSVFVLSGVLFTLQSYAELLHRLDDQRLHGADSSDAARARLLAWLRRLPKLSFALSLAASCLNPLFLNTSFWSLVRCFSLRRLDLTQKRMPPPLGGGVGPSEGAVQAAPEDTAEGEAASRRRASEGETSGFPSELTRVSELRRQLWHPVWSLYEFAIYGGLAMCHRLL